MNKKIMLAATLSLILITGCATFQSVVKSTFPYTTYLVIPGNITDTAAQSTTSLATSFDQDIQKDGNAGARIKDARVVSATLKSKSPSDFNLGNLAYVRIFVAKGDGTGEVMVAYRTDITDEVGNKLVLDVNNAVLLDELIKGPNIKIKMVYKLRNPVAATTTLHLSLSINASPGN